MILRLQEFGRSDIMQMLENVPKGRCPEGIETASRLTMLDNQVIDSLVFLYFRNNPVKSTYGFNGVFLILFVITKEICKDMRQAEENALFVF